MARLVARGYMRSGQGNPDEARSARYILKDYVNAKLLFCHPPPGIPDDEFNSKTHENSLRRMAGKKRAPVTRVGKGADTFVPTDGTPTSTIPSEQQGYKSKTLDTDFFANNAGGVGRAFISGKEFSRSKLYPHQNAISNDGTPLGAKYARMAAVIASQEVVFNGKKHHKKMKRVKQRSGKGYD